MLKLLNAILGLTLLLALFCDSAAHSQQRSQQMRVEPPEATNTEPRDTDRQQGTEQSPLIVKVAPTSKTDHERAEEAKERDRIVESERKKEESDRKLVEFTGELAFFTKGLFGATVALVIATIGLGIAAYVQSRDMKASVRAAQQLADADRPHMLPVKFQISGMRQPPGDDGQVRSLFEYKFINYGRSPAFMKRYCFVIRIGNELAPIPEYGEPTQTSLIIAVNGWWGSQEPSGILVAVDDAANILNGTANYFIYGYIEYSDVADQTHKFRFAYQFFWGAGDTSERFRPAGPDSYREYI